MQSIHRRLALPTAATVLAVMVACGFRGGGFPCDYGDSGYSNTNDEWDSGCPFCWESGTVVRSAIQPTFPPTVVAATPPPPISGGTLIVTRDGRFAVAADPDRDRIYVVDLAQRALLTSTELNPGDEPGRLIDDASGRVHVSLRGGGALATLDLVSGVVSRRPVCPAPRGVAWDASTDLVWVACATGELVALAASGGAAVQSRVLERDLRDVVAANGSLAVSKFRSAEILRLASDGSIARRDQQPDIKGELVPHVAWRMIQGVGGETVVVHQLESLAALPTQAASAYGGCNKPPIALPPPQSTDGGKACPADTLANFASVGCDELPGAVVSALTVLDSDGGVHTSRMFPASLPVDVAMSRDGSMFGVVAAGDAFVPTLGSILWLTPCGDLARSPVPMGKSGRQPIAVAFDPSNDLVVQTREPAELWIYDATTGTPTTIPLSASTRDDTGHDVFHTQAGAMIACASCHPEGGDDGHTWNLDNHPRRTPSLRGTVAGTAPYHWPGDEPTLDVLVDDVYTTRMNGAVLASDQKSALTTWVQSIPAPAAPSWVDPDAAKRGQLLFADTTVGCSKCHSGPKLTDNLSWDVGTGEVVQAPPLVGVGWRTPLLHDGCAATMADRFDKCATPHHGDISALTAGNIADLVAYLETL